jgi:hypothetical protein
MPLLFCCLPFIIMSGLCEMAGLYGTRLGAHRGTGSDGD